jgi:hypothetical protein
LTHLPSFKLIREMAIAIRDDFDAVGLRVLAGRTKDASQTRGHLAIASVCEVMDFGTAAQIGGIDPGSSPGPDAARLGAPFQNVWSGWPSQPKAVRPFVKTVFGTERGAAPAGGGGS